MPEVTKLTLKAKNEFTTPFLITFKSDYLKPYTYLEKNRILLYTLLLGILLYTNDVPAYCQCYQHGHTIKYCQNPIACRNCGEVRHQAEGCDNTVLCLYCKQQFLARYYTSVQSNNMKPLYVNSKRRRRFVT